MTWDKVCELLQWGLSSSHGCAERVPVSHHLHAGLAPHPSIWLGISPTPSPQPCLDIPGHPRVMPGPGPWKYSSLAATAEPAAASPQTEA